MSRQNNASLPARPSLLRVGLVTIAMLLVATVNIYQSGPQGNAINNIIAIVRTRKTTAVDLPIHGADEAFVEQNVQSQQAKEPTAPVVDPAATYSDMSIANTKCAPLENPPRLEMVHVPKTGGSSLVLLAAENGIPWSKCHWYTNAGRIQCPNYTADREKHHRVFPLTNWHVPPMYLEANITNNVKEIFNPYRDNTTQLFAVVRDPYDRIVSEYRYNPSWKKSDGWDRSNATQLNQWVLQTLSQMIEAQPGSLTYFLRDGHMIPQYDYIRGNEHRMHILRQERLAQEFACLARVFQLPEAMVVNLSHSNKGAGRLSKHDLSPQALRLIEQM